MQSVSILNAPTHGYLVWNSRTPSGELSPAGAYGGYASPDNRLQNVALDISRLPLLNAIHCAPIGYDNLLDGTTPALNCYLKADAEMEWSPAMPGMHRSPATMVQIVMARGASQSFTYQIPILPIGDPYLDTTTEWLLKTYNGYATVCTGGVWLKKKAVITSDLQAVNPDFQWPADDDYHWYSKWDYDNANADRQRLLRNQVSASLPYDAGNNPQVYNQGSWPYDYAGKRYNLRFLAPGFNFRTPLKPGKPSDDGKSMDDYFFLPCLGQYSYTYKDRNDVDHSGKPSLILVGGQGFYWTRTPVMYNFGGTKYYYWDYYTDTHHTNNTAFYLNIHYNYIALSWQNAGDNLRTGMRVATKDLFK